MGWLTWVLTVIGGAAAGGMAGSLAGLARSGRSMALIVAGGVLGAIAGVQWASFGPTPWEWPVLPALIGGFLLALLVALIRRTVRPADQ